MTSYATISLHMDVGLHNSVSSEEASGETKFCCCDKTVSSNNSAPIALLPWVKKQRGLFIKVCDTETIP